MSSSSASSIPPPPPPPPLPPPQQPQSQSEPQSQPQPLPPPQIEFPSTKPDYPSISSLHSIYTTFTPPSKVPSKLPSTATRSEAKHDKASRRPRFQENKDDSSDTTTTEDVRERVRAQANRSREHQSQTASSKKSVTIGEKMEAFMDKNAPKMVQMLRGEEDMGPKVADGLLETFDYDNIYDHMNERSLEDGAKSSSHHRNLLLMRLILTVLIAFVTALLMFIVTKIVSFVSSQRINTTIDLIEDGYTTSAYFYLLFISILITAISSALVTIVAPAARGGGVPYLFAYLNGTNVAHYFTVRIVGIKVLALAFTIAGGLTLGMEGPFVYIGGGVALLMSKSLNYIPMFSSGGKYSRILRNIKEERIFMAGGLAAGLAVAFNAPIAGILFAVEGGTSFLTITTVIRIFGCAMFAMFFKSLFINGWSMDIKNNNLITILLDPNAPDYAWLVQEIFAFTLIAIIGGILGAIAVHLNVQITKWRHHYMADRIKANMIEVALITAITASVNYVLPLLFECKPMPPFCASKEEVRCRVLFCPTGHYSEIGTLIYSSSDTVARNLFDRTLLPSQEFDPFPLLVYMIFYLLLVAWVYGAYVPGGLFVPSVVIGGIMGRIVGYQMTAIYSSINVGVYALLGAGAMLGGFTRLALPIIIMLVEMTGDATYLLPIMYVATLSKLLGDLIEPPLYPQHMLLEKIPQLGDKLNPQIAFLTAKDIMIPAATHVLELDELGHILDVLDESKSSMLPVTDQQGRFVGMIMRTSITYALQYTPLYKDLEDAHADAKGRDRNVLNVLTTENTMDWHETVDAAHNLSKFDDHLLKYLINLAPFMDSGAFSVQQTASVKRVHALFRRVGLSHLAVVNQHNQLVGVITRRSLLTVPSAIATLTDDDEVGPMVSVHSENEEESKQDLDRSHDDRGANPPVEDELEARRRTHIRRKSTVERIAMHTRSGGKLS